MQLSLWAGEKAEVGGGWSRVRHIELGDGAWLEYAPTFVSGHEALMERLASGMAWKQERRVMYEREVDVPRLVCGASNDETLDPVLRETAGLLATRYGATFRQVGLAYYRDGRDSVAWHRDKMPRDRDTLVCILSLGAPRKLMLRPFGGGRSRTFVIGQGDLLVMGGSCQLRWEHCVPKTKHAAPRISCMFRHVYDDRVYVAAD